MSVSDDEDNMTEWVPSDVEEEEETNMAGEPRYVRGWISTWMRGVGWGVGIESGGVG